MSEEGKVCPACGTLNPPTAKFCMNCGTNLLTKEPSQKLIKIEEDEKILLKSVFLVMTIILLLDAVLNKYVLIAITGATIVGVPYYAAFLLTLASLYIVTKKTYISSHERIIILLATIIGLLSTIFLYILSISADVRTYSPLWIAYLLILPTTWKIYKKGI